MRKSRRRQLSTEPVLLDIETLSHDGRGIGRIDGKAVFVDGALPGESIKFTYTDSKRSFDEGRVQEVLSESPLRQAPPCPHALICGGCSLQHMKSEEQIVFKQRTLTEHFQHFGEISPEQNLKPLTGPTLGYRRKARLAVKYVPKKGGALVGFREKRNSFVTNIDNCPVLDPRIDQHIPDLKKLVAELDCRAKLPQIEVAAGDDEVALVFRHLEPLSDGDLASISGFCEQRGLHAYLQPKGPSTVHRIVPVPSEDLEHRREEGHIGPRAADRLHYKLSAFDLKYAFHPMDFTQVNASINERMVAKAVAALELTETDMVLDLFCGLGNFTLPIAQSAARVIGVEGSEAMVDRAYENAKYNKINNVEFFAADLSKDIRQTAWSNRHYNKILLDPPRSGALELVQILPTLGGGKTAEGFQLGKVERIVYVSCNPATLARDAGELQKLGFKLEQAGVMDMFPHTTHVESLAVFVRT